MNINSNMSSMFQTQRPPPPTGQGLTEQLDADGSGSLSATEIEDTPLAQMIGGRFDEVDLDSDGLLTVDELDTDIAANAPTEGDRPPPPPGGGQGGAEGPSSSGGVDLESLFETLFAAVETEAETEDATASDVVQTLYGQMQDILA